jgi:uncharacterized membrane protein
MPYCVQCGNGVATTDRFCGKCGSPQASAASTHSGSTQSGTGSSGPGSGGGTAATAGAPGFGGDFMAGLSNRNAALLCYIPMVGWVAGIIVLASERFRHETEVRFHAFQGLYLFVAWLIVEWVVAPTRFWFDDPLSRLLTHGLQLVIFFAWIFMLIKVSQDGSYKLPIVGELAERSVSEQRT